MIFENFLNKHERSIKFIRGKECLGIRFNTYQFHAERAELETLIGALISSAYITRAELNGLEHGEFEVFFNSLNCSKDSFRNRCLFVEAKIFDYLKSHEDPSYNSCRQKAQEALSF